MSTFLAAVAAVVAGAIGGLIADAVVDKRHRARPYLLVLVVVALAVVAVQTVAELSKDDDKTSSHGGGPGTPPASPAVPGTTEPGTTGPDTPEPEPSEPASAMATSLLDLPAVNEDTDSSIDLDDPGTIEIDGTSFGRALVYECSMYCDGSSPQVREVSLGRKYQRFTATAAVLDTSTGSHRVDVTLDGRPPRTYTAKPGVPRKIDLDVSGVSRMRIQLYAPGKLKSPLQAGVDATAGKNGGGLPGVGLGDPLLLP